jgi:hypothetical protein
MENIEQNPTKYIARMEVQREMQRLRTINLQTVQRLRRAHELCQHRWGPRSATRRDIDFTALPLTPRQATLPTVGKEI